MDKAIQAWFSFRGGRHNLPWVARRGTREQLARFFGSVGVTSGVEVGTQRGLWAKVLCESSPTLRLTCVDPWRAYATHRQDEQDGFYQATVERLAGHTVTIQRQCSLDAAPTFAAASLDFVYIDGAHDFDNAMADILAWVPKVKPGGIVAVHDFHMTDVRCAVEAYARCHNLHWYVTNEQCPTAFWVKR
jgi:predicted O-methyltransferase YrrM